MAVGDDLRNANEQAERLQENARLIQDAFGNIAESISAGLQEAIDNATGLDDIGRKVQKTFGNDIVKGLKSMVTSIDKQVSLQSKLNRGADITKELEQEREKVQNTIIAAKQRIAILAANDVELEQELLAELEQQETRQNAILKSLEEQNDEIQNSVGLTGNLIGGLGGVLEKLGMGPKTAGLLTSAMEDAKAQGGGLATQLKNTGLNIKGAIKPTDIFSALLVKSVDAVKKIDVRVASFRKNLGLSARDAVNLNDKFAMTALTSNTIGINVDTLTKSVNDLNSALGDTAIIFDQDLLESATFLRERFGLSEEAVANITQESLATGRSLENIKDEQLASLVAAEKTLQVNLNTNKALEKANSISGALRLNLEQAPGGLVKAVAQATALGLEIGQTAKMAGKLLEFESSIEAELEAELLTGKQLNLEQARLLALKGDTAGAAAEVAKQVGSSAEFAGMNVIQQKALADAVGLTTDELADSLRKQESISSEAEKFQERTAKGAEEAATSLSVQEKLAGAVKKLAGVLEFSVIAAAMLAGALAGIATGGFASAALAAAGGATVAGLLKGYQSVQGDDIISPDQGGSGYGKRTLFGPEGAIALNNRDTIVAGTDLKMGNDIVSPGTTEIKEVSSPSIDLSPLVEQMNTMNATLNALLNKEGTVTLDGTKVGTALTVGSYKLQ